MKDKRFPCDYPGCKKVFNRRDYLERHATNHLAIKPFYCIYCKRHFCRKDLYDNHMNTRFHAKRVEEQAQGRTVRTESVSSQTSIAQMNHTYPEAVISNIDEEGLCSPMHMNVREPSISRAFSAPAAPDVTQPLFNTTGDYMCNSNHLPPAFQQGFTMDCYTDHQRSLSTSNELSPSVALNFPGPIADFSAVFDYQDSDLCDPIRPSARLYCSQYEHQEPVNHSRWSQCSDPFESRLIKEDDIYSVSPSNSATSAPSPRATNPLVPPIRSFLLGRSTKGCQMGSLSTIADTNSSGSPSIISSLSTAPTSHSFQVETNPPRNEERKRASSGTAITSLAGEQYSQNLFEIYVTATQHLQSLKTDMHAFEDSEKLRRLLREPSQESLFAENFNNQFLWFFDNHYDTSNAKIGYDHCYTQINGEYEIRAKKYENGGRYQPPANREHRPLDETASYMVLRILKHAPRELFEDPTMIDYYMHIAWGQSSAVHYIVHLPTFDPSHCHPTLLATLVVLGMAISRDSQAELAAKILYPGVLSATYESVLDTAACSGSDRHETLGIGQLQAFALLMRYERLILGSETARLSLLHGQISTPMIDRFFWVLLSTVHHWNQAQQPIWSPGANQKILWATVGPESYTFFPYCMANLQWREWALYEMAKRTLHFALFCDNMYCLGADSDTVRPLSIFNMDIHMICNEWLWNARSPAEFFYIVGPTKTIQYVPYLGLIKSLVRFRRIPSTSANRRVDQVRPGESPPHWSLFSLRILFYGLANIVSRLYGVSESGEPLVQQILSTDYMSELDGTPFATGIDWGSRLFDRSIQSRLYRGLDLWLQYFEETYGKVTERIFRIGGGSNDNDDDDDEDGQVLTTLNDDLAMIDLDDQREGIPGYVFVAVFCHYSSFLLVHEDLPIVLQVASHMKGWLDAPVQMSYASLLDRLCVPLYTQWLQSNEATAMLSTSCLTILWLDASMGRLPMKLFANRLLASVTFIAVLVIWMHDLTRGGVPVSVMQSTLPPLVLENYSFIRDAGLHLQLLSGGSNVPMSKGTEDPNSSFGFANSAPLHRFRDLGVPGDKIRAVILVAECALYGRPNSERLVSFLMRLLEVIDPRLTSPIQQAVLSGSGQFYSLRHTT